MWGLYLELPPVGVFLKHKLNELQSTTGLFEYAPERALHTLRIGNGACLRLGGVCKVRRTLKFNYTPVLA